MRCMLIIRSTGELDVARFQRATEQMIHAWVMLVAEALQQTGQVVRFTPPTDAEAAREAIAGFVLVQVASVEEAAAWAHSFRSCEPAVLVEVRPVRDALGAEFEPERIRAVA